MKLGRGNDVDHSCILYGPGAREDLEATIEAGMEPDQMTTYHSTVYNI